ncbi:MAG: hypothetical protein UT40_C0041G0004 [Candidatus Woesebacteria bacterium GW2011_GWA1_39_21b]|uniref:Uncharacterized protein n=1 Tax=Candidatus Woesebacteria bacterium GW2011_GWA1_39_21b TaxID=1618551 RepID=A0A0G0N6L1_9BACT|nr:MAG: hypothetical protein US72_C0024G0004 [Microgenomates group bacterium GW2011_GWC1_38_12]KKR11073.1 MAG: hypothetical protein UT40_C0041G0004 [Candidatus Woesebacteria bacterium GW2011_GWA1_39_21b]KKS77477.1 MAG: hypothetical protein UV50_C0005G0032 [Parcubacteria group bacterium GW2011_GWB1_42_9]
MDDDKDLKDLDGEVDLPGEDDKEVEGEEFDLGPDELDGPDFDSDVTEEESY